MKPTTPCLPQTRDSRLPVYASNPRTAPEPSICLGREKISPGRPSGSGAESDGDTDAIASIEQSMAGGLSCGNGSPYTTDDIAKLSVRPLLRSRFLPRGTLQTYTQTGAILCAQQFKPTPRLTRLLVRLLCGACPLPESDTQFAGLQASGSRRHGGVAQFYPRRPGTFRSSIPVESSGPSRPGKGTRSRHRIVPGKACLPGTGCSLRAWRRPPG